MIDSFIAARKPRWDRLESLVWSMQNGRLKGMTPSEIEEFGLLYRETASDLAIARRDYPSSSLVTYLNALMAQAQPYIYTRHGGKMLSVARFFRREFPAAFRRNARLVLIAFLAFFLPALLAYFLCLASPRASAVLAPQGIQQRIEDVRQSGKWADIPASQSSLAASTIMTNNIQVAILAFVGGLLLGLLTMYVLINNGIMLGSVAALAQKGGVGFILWSFVSPHGWIELSVIFIAGGAGLGIARGILLPGLLTRGDALVKAARESARLLLGGAALLVVAGTIEGFISPSSLPGLFKIAFGICTGIALYSYLLLVGRKTT